MLKTPDLTRAVGVGLHSGQRVELTLRPRSRTRASCSGGGPAPGAGGHSIRAEAVTDTRLASTIGAGNAKVHTVEHLMSACAGLGLDNLYVDITAEEVPILDGSSASFVFLLQSAGVELQNAQALHPRHPPGRGARGRGANAKWARLTPYHGYKLVLKST